MYEVVIGLEVHVQLLTQSKLFCGCSTRFGMPPNTQTCPVCIGMPGVLPMMNRRAFDLALKAGLAFHCDIARFTKWDRKNYYYPDLPKAYQISQYDLPFATGGGLGIRGEGGERFVRLIRIHLEEDAGKNLHSETGDDSLVDLNRAGTPLLEIVTEPDLRAPAEAREFLETVRTLLRDLEVSDCEMQEGSLRCDANVNLHIPKDGQTYKTPIVEIKNLNSIKAVEKALEFEAARQLEEFGRTGKTLGSAPKQTRGWDDVRLVTRPQREKEEAADYRYFPEPDLAPVVVDDAWLERLAAETGETSDQRRQRFQTELGLTEYNARVLVEQGRAVADYFERLVELGVEAKSAANWVVNDLLARSPGRIKSLGDLAVDPPRLAELIGLVKGNQLNLNDAREKVLPALIESGRRAGELAREMSLEVVADTAAIDALVEEVLGDPALANAVADYRAGKTKAFAALVGGVMRRSKGKFPPAMVNEALKRKLG